MPVCWCGPSGQAGTAPDNCTNRPGPGESWGCLPGWGDLGGTSLALPDEPPSPPAPTRQTGHRPHRVTSSRPPWWTMLNAVCSNAASTFNIACTVLQVASKSCWWFLYLLVVLDFDCKIVILQCVGMVLTTCSATVFGNARLCGACGVGSLVYFRVQWSWLGSGTISQFS